MGSQVSLAHQIERRKAHLGHGQLTSGGVSSLVGPSLEFQKQRWRALVAVLFDPLKLAD